MCCRLPIHKVLISHKTGRPVQYTLNSKLILHLQPTLLLTPLHIIRPLLVHVSVCLPPPHLYISCGAV